MTSTTGPPMSTPCSPNGTGVPPERGRDAARRSCRSAAWWSSDATPTPRCDGCAVGCRSDPTRMPCWAPLFHDWVQRFYGAERLFDLDDLPGAVDGQLARARRGGPRRAAGRVHGLAHGPPALPSTLRCRSTWSSVTPWYGGASTRCSRTPTAPPWSTGRRASPGHPEANRHAAVQLAVYRVAWAALRGVPAASVRAAFHYVRSGRDRRPESLPEAEDLAALLELPAA